jgi:hypothetical protein
MRLNELRTDIMILANYLDVATDPRCRIALTRLIKLLREEKKTCTQ